MASYTGLSQQEKFWAGSKRALGKQAKCGGKVRERRRRTKKSETTRIEIEIEFKRKRKRKNEMKIQRKQRSQLARTATALCYVSSFLLENME